MKLYVAPESMYDTFDLFPLAVAMSNLNMMNCAVGGGFNLDYLDGLRDATSLKGVASAKFALICCLLLFIPVELYGWTPQSENKLYF